MSPFGVRVGRCQNSIKSLLHSRGIEFNKLRRVNQTHSKVVASAAECLIPHPTLGLTSNFDADGNIANSYYAKNNVTLLVTIADCLPIFIAADNGAYGIVHSGWKGTGIIENAIIKYGNRFLNRIFTDNEIMYCNSKYNFKCLNKFLNINYAINILFNLEIKIKFKHFL